MVDPLRITLFGGLTITRNGQSINLLTRKNEALFAYLACHPQQAIRRELLAALFWSEKDEKNAMGNLRTSLSGLRNISQHLEIERFSVTVPASEQLWVDILAFEKLEQITLLTSPSGLLTESELTALTEAAKLYRGAFLQGFTLRESEGFDEWARKQRERFHISITRVLQKLVTHYLTTEDYAAGISWAQRLLEIAPEDEASRRDMMSLLAGSGQTAAALQEFELLKRYLQEDGLEPSSETLRLYDEIANNGRRTTPLYPVTAPLAPPPSNLTQPLVPIVGRQQELERIGSRLTDERCRLITLVGPGGVGKTRLANEVGLFGLRNAEISQVFTDGIYFVSLQSIDQQALLPNAIASVVGCQMQGVVEPEAQLLAFLRPLHMLLILDNFEHLLDASELVLHMLQQAPDLKVLTTSLEPLNFQGEWLQQVNGLQVPLDNDPEWYDSPAVQLFVRSVEQFDPDFNADGNRPFIIDICQQLQGLPLGILLAAASLRAYTCREVAEELQRNLDFLATTMRNVPLRHRSLRAVFDYVWELLSPADRQFLPRLAIFEGGFSAEAAHVVAGIQLPLLIDYSERSLLQRAPVTKRSGSTEETKANSFFTLHRALHGYFLEKLSAEKERFQAVRRSHAEYFIQQLAQQEQNISGSGMGEALATVHNQLANIRSAWHYAVAQSILEHIEAGYETLSQYYLRIGPFVEGENALRLAAQMVRQSLAQNSANAERYQKLLARLLVNISQFQIALAVYAPVIENLLEADTIATQLQDQVTLAMVHLVRGRVNYYMGVNEKARQQLELAHQLISEQPLQRIEAQIQLYLGHIYGAQSDYQTSREHLLRGLEFCRRDGDPITELLFYRGLARIAFFVGDYSEATALNEQVLAGYNNLGARAGTGLVLNNLGAILHQVGDYERARDYYLNAYEIQGNIGDTRGQGLITANLCLLYYHLNDYDTAREYGKTSLAIAQERNDRDSEAYVLACLGHIARAQNDLTQAEHFYQQALALRLGLQQQDQKLEPLAGLAIIALERNDNTTANAHAESIYAALQHRRPGGIVEYIKLLLVCFDIFKHANDPRVPQIVQLGVEILHERASKISKPSQRRSFLRRVASHRRMMALAEEYKVPLPEWLLKTNY